MGGFSPLGVGSFAVERVRAVVSASEGHAEEVASQDAEDGREVAELAGVGPRGDVEGVYGSNVIEFEVNGSKLAAKFGHEGFDLGGCDAERGLSEGGFHGLMFAGFSAKLPSGLRLQKSYWFPVKFLHYLALGDSISIDLYTGLEGGGAPTQFARLIGVEKLQDATLDGCRTLDMEPVFEKIEGTPDLVTVTLGGNDLLEAVFFREGGSALKVVASMADPILTRLEGIADRVSRYGATTLLNTVYDPTDGNDRFAEGIGLDPSVRCAFKALNLGIAEIAARHGFLLADLHALFQGHGFWSGDPWLVKTIEPNLAGATAIAAEWHRLVGG